MHSLRISKETVFYLAVLVMLLPAMLLRDFTPSNELRYLCIADEALRNHHFFAFTYYGEAYADKPPLYLWLVMLCRWISGGHYMWLLCIFSILPAWGILRIMDGWTANEMPRENHWLGRVMLLTSGFFLGTALTLRMDMLMTLFIVLALRAFWRIYRGEGGEREGWLFPLYVFLAIFTKGPLGLLIPLVGSAVFLAMKRQLRQFFRYWNLRTWGVLLVCCGAWFAAVYAEGGASYLHNLLFHQTVDRAVNSFTHDRPMWYYAVSYWYCLAPWSLLAVGVLLAACRRRCLKSDLQRLFIAVSVSTLVMLSCISGKLQIYMLPAFPFIIYFTVLYLPDFKNKWLRVCLAVPAAIFALALPALFIAARGEDTAYLRNGWMIAAAVVCSASGVVSLWLLWRGKNRKRIVRAVYSLAAGLLLTGFVGGFALPTLNDRIGYGALCEKALEISEKHGITDFKAWQIRRPRNMHFYLHHPVWEIESENPTHAAERHPFILLTRKRELKNFPGQESQVVGKYAVVVCD